MEKKSTKIAYFVALGIFVVLLVVLGISYKDAPILIEGATTPFAGTFWSLLPPIVAIVLALISKEVYSSLFLGCLVGALLFLLNNEAASFITGVVLPIDGGFSAYSGV